jgi:hypothetical protein
MVEELGSTHQMKGLDNMRTLLPMVDLHSAREIVWSSVTLAQPKSPNEGPSLQVPGASYQYQLPAETARVNLSIIYQTQSSEFPWLYYY